MGWSRFFRRRWWDEERARELQAHLDIETDVHIARGLSPKRPVRPRKLGNTLRIREEIYAMNTLGLVDTLWRDIRYGGRLFSRDPGFTAVALLTLALGIGGVTVIYTVIRNILLDPFPYTDSARMVDVLVYDTATGRFRGQLRMPEFLDYVEQSDVFEDAIGTISAQPVMMPTREGTEVLAVSRVTPNTFAFLGMPALVGRGIVEADGQDDLPIIVLSHKAWVTHFGSDPHVVGRALTLGDEIRTIVGVMPPRFTWHVADAWIPKRLSRTEPDAETPAFWLQARLKPGISLEQAEAQLNTIAARRALERPDEYPKQFRIGVVTVIDFVVGRFRGVLYMLFVAVSLLLLIACCNLANMLLARGTARERELTLRAALGASRARLIGQLLIESLLLALAGAAAGCLLAYAGVAAIAHFLPQQNVPYEVELRLQWPALLVSLGAAVLAALLFGLLPAWYGARRDLLPGLKEGGKGTGANGRHAWVRHGILVGEVAISLVLLLGAGLMMRSFLTLVRGDLGFSPANIVLSSIRLPPEGYATEDARQAYYRAAIDRVAALPGVTAAATGLFIGGLPAQLERMGSGSGEPHQGRVTPCTEDYLRVLGVGAIRGRDLSFSDVSAGRRVAVVNQALVRQLFGEADPLGASIRITGVPSAPNDLKDATFEIVGVIRDIGNRPTEAPLPAAYLPATVGLAPFQLLVARSAGDPALLLETIKREIRSIDRSAAVGTFTLQEIIQNTYAQPRFTTIILAAFAGTGLLLVLVGVYGVMAYAVARRRHEIAIRMALGAERRHVLRGVLRTAALLLVSGIGAGLVASVATNRLLAAQLPVAADMDPLTMVVAAGLIVLTGLMASYVPARRAARVDPMEALRHE